MPQDLSTLADPRLILLAWGAGLALAAGLVTGARVVGPGFTWLAGGVAFLVGIGAAFPAGAWWARGGLALLVLAALTGRRPAMAGPLLTLAGAALLTQASLLAGFLPAAAATLVLGGVTGEMMLGHWYLVDPTLPRWSLRALALAGLGGIVVDAVVVGSAGLPDGSAAVAYWALAGLSALLMTGVLGALRHPAYSGVMAATGLSYLAVLTTLGAVFLGRALASGFVPFG